MCRSNAISAGRAIRTVQDVNDAIVKAPGKLLDRARIIEQTPVSAINFDVFGNKRRQIAVKIARMPILIKLIQSGMIATATSEPVNFENRSMGKPRSELY